LKGREQPIRGRRADVKEAPTRVKMLRLKGLEEGWTGGGGCLMGMGFMLGR
jgi:hypothetical protein